MGFSSATVSIGKNTKKSDYDRVMDNTVHILRGLATFTGLKTFQSGTVHTIKPKAAGISTLSSTGSVSLEVQYVNSSAVSSVVDIKTTIREIGDWNMDADSFVNIALPAHITKANIRHLSAIIRHDEGSVISALLNDDNDGSSDNNKITVESSNDIQLRRRVGGFFDNTSYNATSYNRGWIMIMYQE